MRRLLPLLGLVLLSVAACGPDPAVLLNIECEGNLEDQRVRNAIIAGATRASRRASYTSDAYADGKLVIQLAPVVDVPSYVLRLQADLQAAMTAPTGAKFTYSVLSSEGRTVRLKVD